MSLLNKLADSLILGHLSKNQTIFYLKVGFLLALIDISLVHCQEWK